MLNRRTQIEELGPVSLSNFCRELSCRVSAALTDKIGS
jgi:hypothetical protein